ncbi:MAG: PD-(D/E)XK nuclease family protein, partial [Anaerolineae bacterium]|nr:PD-(D/E)XK nuclease family protein [Anaerolineae bacterium]
PTWDEEGDPVDALLDEFTEANLSYALGEFFAGVKPPAQAAVETYVGWLEDLIGADPADLPDDDAGGDFSEAEAYTVNLLQAIRAGDEATRARDLIALQELKKGLRGLLAAQELLMWMRGAQTELIAWDEFYLQLKSAVDHAEVNPQPNRGGRVLVTSAANARGLPHDYVFVPGLSEGIFPAPVPEDPLYLDSERRALIQRGVLLRTAAERATDDGLFYELISLPRLALTLTRPTAQDGQPWTESHLWRATRAVFADLPVQRLRAGEVVAPGDAASLAEVALAVANSLTHDTVSPEVAGLYNWLLYHQRDYWTHLRTARQVEARRLTQPQSFDQYSGKLNDPRLIERVARTLDDNRLWSASQFNDYGACPFRFFARRLLKLEELKTPEAGMDILQTGSLNHQLLERTYETLRQEGLSIVPEHTEAALEILYEVAREVLANAPEQYGFRPTRLWEQEQKTLLDRLIRLIQIDFSADNPIARQFPGEERRPYRLEAPFGRDGGVEVSIDLGEEGRLKLNGYIDRIDQVGDGLVVIDYKTGSTKFRVEDMREGRNFQMIVYLLAAQQIMAADHAPYAPREVLGGLFWHIRRGEISGVLQHPRDDDVTTDAQVHLERYVGLMRTGDFAVAPGKVSEGKCVSYCEYRQLCRMCGV